MKKYVIVSIIESLKFPLHEATQKQIWWTAKEKQSNGYSVRIILLTNFNEEFIYENIHIKHVNRWSWNPFIIANRIHIITGSISIWLLGGFFSFGKKKLTLVDGAMFGYKNRDLRKLIVHLLPFIYNKIIVFSNYQKKKLKIKGVLIESPKLPIINIGSKFKRSSNPSLLYMGHLSYFKGVDTIILAFKKLIIEIPDLTWVIANNSVRGDKELIDEVSRLKKLYPENIITKGIVDPIEELSTAWVYLYPFKEALGTMAYALSLYEAEQCHTPYIACDVGANSEFFNNDYLINIDDDQEMIRKIKSIIDERKN